MSIKPILFNTEMVRAILEDRKTVTRRVVKPQPGEKLAYIWGGSNHGKWSFSPYNKSRYEEHRAANDWKYWTPPCHADDILYVRETWNYGYFDSSDAELDNSRWFEPLPLDYDRNSYIGSVAGFVYRADFTRPEEYEYGTLDEDNVPKPMPWRPSIHMPREAARIWLRVTDVRVERLQEIDEAGAAREGCSSGGQPVCGGPFGVEDDPGEWTAREHFTELWDSTIKPANREKYGWAANPWVWVIAFERCDAPPQRGVQSATGRSPALSAEKKPEDDNE